MIYRVMFQECTTCSASAVLSQCLGVAQARVLHLQAEADLVARLKGSSQLLLLQGNLM